MGGGVGEGGATLIALLDNWWLHKPLSSPSILPHHHSVSLGYMIYIYIYIYIYISRAAPELSIITLLFVVRPPRITHINQARFSPKSRHFACL